MDHQGPMLHDATIPRSALLLGWLGVLPFAASCLVAVFGNADAAGLALRALVVYGAIILSFMGGAQWGLAMAAVGEGPSALARRLAVSTLPALAAFGLAALASRTALIGLAAVFAALLVYDVSTARSGVAPPWYPALRSQLTAAVVACLLVAAAFGTA